MDPKLQVFLMLKLAKSSLQWLATIWNEFGLACAG